MKRTIFDRTAAPITRRRHFHGGVVAGIVVVLALGTASGAVALGVVPQPFAAKVPTSSPSPSPSRAVVPAMPTPEPLLSPVIPTECAALVDSANYTRLFGSTPVQRLRPVPTGSAPSPIPLPKAPHAAFFDDPALACLWRDPRADITNLSIEIGTVSAEDASTYQADVRSQGFTCSAAHDGTSCQKITPDAEYPVDETETFFVRGTTWIEVRQTNFPTNDLLGAITSHLWTR